MLATKSLSSQFGNNWQSKDFAPEVLGNSNAKAINWGGGKYIIGGLLSSTATDTYKISSDDGNTWNPRTQTELFGAGSAGQPWMITGIAYDPYLFKRVIVGSWNGSTVYSRQSVDGGLTYTQSGSLQMSVATPRVKFIEHGANPFERYLIAYGLGTNQATYSANGGVNWTNLGDLAPSGIVGSANVNDVTGTQGINTIVAVVNQTTDINQYKVYRASYDTIGSGFTESTVASWPSGLNDAFVKIAYGNGVVVAITSQGYISTSSNNGVTFTAPTRYFTDVSSSYPVNLSFFGGRFYLMYKKTGVNAGTYFRQSANGTAWTGSTLVTGFGQNTQFPLLFANSTTSAVYAGYSSSMYSLSTY